MAPPAAALDAAGDLVRTAISGLELLQPRTVREALRMLRDEGPLTQGVTAVWLSTTVTV